MSWKSNTNLKHIHHVSSPTTRVKLCEMPHHPLTPHHQCLWRDFLNLKYNQPIPSEIRIWYYMPTIDHTLFYIFNSAAKEKFLFSIFNYRHTRKYFINIFVRIFSLNFIPFCVASLFIPNKTFLKEVSCL